MNVAHSKAPQQGDKHYALKKQGYKMLLDHSAQAIEKVEESYDQTFTKVKSRFQRIKSPSCIRINQSAIRPRHQQEIAIQKDHKSIYDKVGHHLNEHYFVPMTATILKQYSNQLLHD
ncbi:unnamed protein product, partial [Rotaria socialis]